MDGYLKIKTKIDNKDVDKGIVELENKIKKLQTDNTKNSQEQSSLQEEINRYDELCQKADEYKNKIKQLEKQKSGLFVNGGLPSGQLTNYNSISTQIKQAKAEQIKLNTEIDKQSPKINKISSKLEKVKAKQVENNAKITEYKHKIEQVNLNHIQKGINNVGAGIQNSISKIGRMTLAIFGIRTALNFVNGAISTLSQYNPQIAADVEYIKFALANILLPIIQKIVGFAYTLLSYINAIMSGWFGINLFSGASAKNFQKMQGGASGTAKAVKEIQKSLQGFDEMNVLQDDSESQSGGSGAGGVSPSMDLSGMQGEAPAWLQWIIDNKDIVLGVIAGITAGLISLKLLGLDPLLSLGIGVLVAGIILLIQDVIKFIQDPVWENFINIIRDIGVALTGLGVIIGVLAGNWLILIIGLVILIIAEVIKHWDDIKNILGTVGQWIYDNVITPVWNFIKGLIDFIVEIFWTLVRIIEGITTTLSGILRAPFETLRDLVVDVFNGIKTICQGIANVFRGIFTGDLKTTLNGFKQIFKGIFDALWGIAKAPLNLIIRGINSLIRGANAIHFDVPNWVPGMGGKKFGFNISEIPLLAKGGIISQPTQAIIGEAGKEAVVPLENNLEWLDILADKLSSKISQGGGSYIIQLDGRTIQRGMAKKRQELSFATNGR